MLKLAEQLKQAVAAFAHCRQRPALIGGLAVVAHGVVRATQDIDFLADADDAEMIDQTLIGLGYHCLHRSDDAANYVRGSEQLDLLYAHRPTARQLLAAAREHDTVLGRLNVIGLGGLIAFKLQGLVNDPSRSRDLDDIRALLRVHRDGLNMAELRGYFALFERETLLDELLAELESGND